MSAKFEIIATNDVTSILICEKYTLAGALGFACDLLETWDDVHIREREEGAEVFKIVAKLSAKGLFL